MNVARLTFILEQTTKVLDQKENKSQEDNVVPFFKELDLDSPNTRIVDCQLHKIAVDRAKAHKYQDELQNLLLEYPDQIRLKSGPSYLEVGKVLKSMTLALRLFALGETLGMWDLKTPESLNLPPDKAKEYAEKGLILISGFSPNPPNQLGE